MNNCVSCGNPIPEGQRNCSMCYGDPDHGSDGYYREYLEEWERQAEERLQEAKEYDQLMQEFIEEKNRERQSQEDLENALRKIAEENDEYEYPGDPE